MRLDCTNVLTDRTKMDQNSSSSCEYKCLCETKVKVNMILMYTILQKFGFLEIDLLIQLNFNKIEQV